MKRIIGWFVGNPVAANLLMMILIVGGLISIFQLRQEEMPAIDLGIIEVTVVYLGAAPEEVENGVSLRVEEALEGIQGVDRITSTSGEGLSRVVVEIDDGADRVQVLNEVKSQVDAIITFPVETERPIVSLLTLLNDGMEIAIYGNADERTLKELALEMREEIA
ncbi:MAG: efflux RND transporter permease subunit, partial [Rhodospirillaceae bacterium]|nr:efflux RND transporter permease subunit [Rhodospirillaceae bacterium]